MDAERAPYTLYLLMQECRDLDSERDVVDVTELVAGFGLRPGVGAWTPGGGPRPVADVDLREHLAGVRVSVEEVLQASQPPAGRAWRRAPFEGDVEWGFGVATAEPPIVGGTLSFERLVQGSWGVSLLFYTWHHRRAGQLVEAFADGWGEQLERLGDALYERTQPAVGALTVESDGIDYARAAAARRFLAGWRTWFGPPYVEVFGREWLLGLPDEATPLEGDGVRHALSAPASALVAGDPAVYASLWPYLEQAGVTSTWPRSPRTRRRRTQADVD